MSTYNPEFMKEALTVAQEAYDHFEVPVGCVFVLDNQKIIARGRNKPNESYNVWQLKATMLLSFFFMYFMLFL